MRTRLPLSGLPVGLVALLAACAAPPSVQNQDPILSLEQTTFDAGPDSSLATFDLRFTATAGAIASDADLTLRVVPNLVPEVAITDELLLVQEDANHRVLIFESR